MTTDDQYIQISFAMFDEWLHFALNESVHHPLFLLLSDGSGNKSYREIESKHVHNPLFTFTLEQAQQHGRLFFKS